MLLTRVIVLLAVPVRAFNIAHNDRLQSMPSESDYCIGMNDYLLQYFSVFDKIGQMLNFNKNAVLDK